MKNKTLAIFGIGTYILGVVTSATDVEGNPVMPIVLFVIPELATIIFIIMATIRLWKKTKCASILLASSTVILFILSVVQSIVSPLYGSPIIILLNITKVINFIAFIWAVSLLWKMGKHSGQINPAPKEDHDPFDWIEHRVSQIEQRMELPLGEAEKESLSEELSSLSAVLVAREVKRETKVEEIRLTMEEDLREKNAIKGEQDFLPTFQKWLVYSGNVRLDRTEAFVVYCEELERLYNEKLGRIE